MSKYFKWAELPARKDIYTYDGTRRWGNHDLYPIPKKERVYGYMGYYSYYLVSGISITGFSMGSAYVSAGLSAQETIGAVLVGCVCAALNACLGVQVGLDKSLGFTMSTRTTYGLYGNLLPLFTTLLGNLVFAGIQAYYGAQSISLIIGAVIPAYANMHNTLPASAAITTRDLISFFIYWALFIPVVLYIPMYKLKTFMFPSITMTAATLLGVLGWIIKENGGSTDPLITSPVKVSSMNRSFLFLQCVFSTAAVWGGSGDRLSDWSLVGTFTTTAFYSKYGTVLWTPLDMLAFIQETHYAPACRAGTFFASIGLLTSLIYINIVQNTLSFGMDFASVLPKYILMKRGSMIVVIVSIACNPRRFLTQAVVFVEVFSGFTIFATATVAITNTDYWIIRRRKWKIPDLYQRDGIYWFWHGISWRAIVTWIIAVIPAFPGFSMSMQGKTDGVAHRIYQMSFFVGYPIAVCTYILINKTWSPEGLGIAENLQELPEDGEIIEGSIPENLSESEKDVGIVEVKQDKTVDM
ncbi:hypothetical protein L207DRAFT_585270 [Hyaloscypha variabilis F]|uniref:Uncharacterized protein n=1 Tax=Hyaloscypha variabilis (strain UAMH 11265 / GT02V1 / F) TaxID=1149755 RepID=A0A2J6RIM0_HYAVF|nr:hypothetical protein L207DRAFT_585270 [Hyaloscypha variabilis F]